MFDSPECYCFWLPCTQTSSLISCSSDLFNLFSLFRSYPLVETQTSILGCLFLLSMLIQDIMDQLLAMGLITAVGSTPNQPLARSLTARVDEHSIAKICSIKFTQLCSIKRVKYNLPSVLPSERPSRYPSFVLSDMPSPEPSSHLPSTLPCEMVSDSLFISCS